MNAIPPSPRLPQAERDRVRKVTGAGRYTADETIASLRAVFLRAPYAHARIISIDTTAARAMPGVIAILTGADCIEANLSSFPVIDRIGTGLVIPERPILAHDIVRHVGEAVAMVIAETQAEALDAAEAIEVDYLGLPPIISIPFALAPGAALVHEKARGNVALHHSNGDAEAVANAMAEAALVIETEVEMPRLAPVTLEPRAAVGFWNDVEGRYELRAPHQGVNEIRRDLAAAFRLPPDRFHVLDGDVGGGFGPRNIAYPEYAALLLAARKIGRAVAWHGNRTESFLTDIQGRGVRVHGRLAIDANHRFTALHMQYDADLGAYITPVAAFAAVHNPLQSVVGCYSIAATHAEFRLLHTHTVPTGPYRGAGRPEMALLIERLVDIAAHRLNLDPFELRALNAIPIESFPYVLPSGARYDSGDFKQLLTTARDRSNWDDFEARKAESATRGMKLGRGMALFVEVSGGGGGPDEAMLTLSANGHAPCLVIETVTASTGQSHARTFANIATPRLGISEIDVTLLASDPNTRLSGAGSYASRSTIAAGSAVAQAADIIAAKVLGLAALRANCAAEDLTLAEGVVKNRDGAAVCSIASLLAEPISATGKVVPTNAFASGCHVVEVEMEQDSGFINLISYLAVDDGGVIIDHQAADAQIHGGIAQGVGEVLGEESATDTDGQMVAASFMDYRMPRAGDLPNYEVVDCGIPSPFNPIGVKGIGEAGTTGALCAVTSAVFNLLDGKALPSMPFTCERMWNAMNANARTSSR